MEGKITALPRLAGCPSSASVQDVRTQADHAWDGCPHRTQETDNITGEDGYGKRRISPMDSRVSLRESTRTSRNLERREIEYFFPR
jgi:hypothetical protein